MKMIRYSYIVVSDADLHHLAAGTVPPRLRTRAAVLLEDVVIKLQRNATKPVRTSVGRNSHAPETV
jgi:hypothetical protein